MEFRFKFLLKQVVLGSREIEKKEEEGGREENGGGEGRRRRRKRVDKRKRDFLDLEETGFLMSGNLEDIFLGAFILFLSVNKAFIKRY